MSDHPAARSRGGILRLALWSAALVGVAAVVYIMGQSLTKPADVAAPAAPVEKSFSEKLEILADAGPAPDLAFRNDKGKDVRLADFKGRVVVMNLWATWCAPCVTEMPTLAALQKAYAGKPVDVVAISIDSDAAAAKARLFIAGNDPLAFYHDPSKKLPFQLKPAAAGMPTTVIYGADGVERGRLSGEADWSGPEARAFLDKLLAEG
jgi:thiol-disulfide isomerase/thioredoxin